jgi:ParB family chromosome partitioning protein
MAPKRDRKGLGRGLSALMADIEPRVAHDSNEISSPSSGVSSERMIPTDLIKANPDQPRRQFSEDALEELAASIRQKGVIQPLILRPDPADDTRYQIVAGERRWRAAQRAMLHELPAIIREFDDGEVLEVAIIENIQRADLNPLEEADGYRQLMQHFDHTQAQLAEAMGKSRSHIANLMRLFDLPGEVQSMVRDGVLSAGHARALITAEDALKLARQVVRDGLSVRETERLAKSAKAPSGPARKRSKPTKDADTAALESDLSATLGMPVSIAHDAASGEGNVTIRYKDLSKLDDLIRLLGGG